MSKYTDIRSLFESRQNREAAVSMSKYMRNMFDFYGIQSPERKKLYREFLKSEKKSKTVDWEFLNECYEDSHREFQYLVYDYLLALNSFVSFEDISKIECFIRTKPWWDTIDFLAKVIGDVSLRDSRTGDLMLSWSESDNIWIRRTAIEYQLGLKDKTDSNLLELIIVNSFGSDEFFINKAIGWALREYSKTNPEWVKDFLNKYRVKMNNLSIKEAGKYVMRNESAAKHD